MADTRNVSELARRLAPEDSLAALIRRMSDREAWLKLLRESDPRKPAGWEVPYEDLDRD